MSRDSARRFAIAALVLGVAGDQLLRADSWRLGFTIWIIALASIAAFAVPAATDADPTRVKEQRVLLAGIGMAALLLVLRDAPILYFVDFVALLGLAALVAWRAIGRPLAALLPRDAVSGGLAAAVAAAVGAPLLALRDAAPGDLAVAEQRSIRGVLLGSVVAAPMLLVVALLLGEADPVFGEFITGLLDVGLVGHLFGSAVAAWVAAGVLRGTSTSTIGRGPFEWFSMPRIDFALLAPGLLGLVVLLSAWIGVQVRVMFGGAEYLIATAGLTVAEYARQGFFELVAVTGIVLAVLLLADELVDHADAKAERSFRTAGWALIGLLAVMMVSALQRLGLYVGLFGLTEDRFLATAVLLWLALVLGWFGWSVLRGGRARFALGVLWVSAGWVLVLNGVDPEAAVVRTNVGRAEAGKEFDVVYHARLSADARPALLTLAPRLGEARCSELMTAMDSVWTKRAEERADWRRWSIPYRRAVTSRSPASATDPASAARSASDARCSTTR